MAQALTIRGLQGAPLSARDDRLINDILTEGLMPGADADEFKVQQQASPNMTVRVGSGTAGDRYVVPGEAGQGTFIVHNRNDPYVGSGNSDVPIANGHASNPRIDGIDLRVYDDEFDSSGFSKAEVVVTQGTPAASPVAPAVPDGAARLATILVPAAESSSIGTGDITDTRRQSVVNGGGVLVVTSATRPLSPFEGMQIFETDTNRSLIYDGTEWVITGQIGAWTLYTPADSNITVGNGIRVAAYHRQGRSVQFRYQFQTGSTSSIGSNPGIGLPFTTSGRPVFAAAYEDGSANAWLGGFARAGTAANIAFLYNPTTGIVTATSPFIWSSSDWILVTGTYEAAA